MKLGTKVAIITIILVVIIAVTRSDQDRASADVPNVNVPTTQMRYIQGIVWVLVDPQPSLISPTIHKVASLAE